MDSGIVVLDASDAEVWESEDGSLTSRRLVRTSHGSEQATLNVSTLREGYEGDVTYDDSDEIVYVLEGEAEVSFDGQTRLLRPGMAMFVPRGSTYHYRASQGDNQVIVVFAPPRRA